MATTMRPKPTQLTGRLPSATKASASAMSPTIPGPRKPGLYELNDDSDSADSQEKEGDVGVGDDFQELFQCRLFNVADGKARGFQNVISLPSTVTVRPSTLSSISRRGHPRRRSMIPSSRASDAVYERASRTVASNALLGCGLSSRRCS